LRQITKIQFYHFISAPRLEIGDKKYILPAEEASFDDASKLCGERNMEIASFESLLESDMVSDFVGSLGKILCYGVQHLTYIN